MSESRDVKQLADDSVALLKWQRQASRMSNIQAMIAA
jgi:hypothetical protein